MRAVTDGTWPTSDHTTQWGGDSAEGYISTTWAGSYPYSDRIDLSAVMRESAALLVGSKWTTAPGNPSPVTTITYSFSTSDSLYAYPEFGLATTLTPFTEKEKAITREVMDSIEAVARVRFVEVADTRDQVGVLRYAYSTKPAELKLAGLGFFPSAMPSGGDIWLVPPSPTKQDPTRPKLILHETLHAIGLKHPFEGTSVLPPEQDIMPNTVMSYSPLSGAASGGMTAMPSTPMPLDIIALQHLYGAAEFNTGNTVYDLSAAEFRKTFKVIWDADGVDTLDASRLSTPVSLNLADGARSKIGVSVGAFSLSGGFKSATYDETLTLAAQTQIENAIGTAGADSIIGNAANNRLTGNGGSDKLDGDGGTDVAAFNGSRDQYTIRARDGAVIVSENGSEVAATLTQIERLEFGDVALALDLQEGAGLVARLIVAIYGASALADAWLVGAGLRLQGQGRTAVELSEIGLADRLGPNYLASDVLELLFANVAGRAPTDAESAHYLSAGSDVPALANLAVFAAGVAENLAQIDFVGLQQHGLAYLPTA